MMGKLRKIAAALVSSCFLCFAALQWNDPDPEIWVTAYLLPAMMGFGAIFRKTQSKMYLTVAVGYFIVGLSLWPDSFHGFGGMKDNVPEIEAAKEAGGLFIVAVGLFFITWLNIKTRQKNEV